MNEHVFSPKHEVANVVHASSPEQPLPPPTGTAPYRMDITSVLPEISLIEHKIHFAGDVGGIKTPSYQQAVVTGMAQHPASFLYIPGDVGYYNGQRSVYHDQFYEPYADLDWPIFAIPGNHDGDPTGGDTSLEGFMANFCQAQPGQHLPEAGEFPRTAGTQPNCYWTLVAPLVTIIGLYTNVPEGGYVDGTQQTWFEDELMDADPSKLLIVALHHPVYSADAYHSGSAAMHQLLYDSFSFAKREPDLVVTGHVHDYQRWTDNSGIPFVVAGAGGYYNLHTLTQKPGYIDPTGATLQAGEDKAHGFLELDINAGSAVPPTAQATYYTCESGTATVADTFTVG